MDRRLPRWGVAAAGAVAFALGVLAGPPAVRGQDRAPAALPLTADSLLAALKREALAARPELAQAQAAAQAERARVPQAGAMPDPVLALGIQNDGFDRLRIGEMETSFWSVGVAQTFPWAGKRGLRSRAQSLGAEQAEADLLRARLTVTAEVERAYLDLVLTRDERRILGTLDALWIQAEGLARSRYETGGGAQSDFLRAQLERSRLAQQRWALAAQERQALAALNRAVGRTIDQPLETTLGPGDLADPALPDSAAALADAEARTPELVKARLAVRQAEARVALARKAGLPDVTLSLGVMPRGSLAPMWQAGLSVPLPLWDASRRGPAIEESGQRGRAAESAAEALARVVRQRLDERRAALIALRETNRLYRAGLLVQSRASATSTLSQYEVGRVPFASVLEALRGYLDDLARFDGSVVAAQRVDVAQRELSLEPVTALAAPALGGASMAGGSGDMTRPTPLGGAAAAPAAPQGASTTGRM